MIFVGGLSGSGKTTLVKTFVLKHPNYVHLGASAILRSINRPTADLDEMEALENQAVLARWLQQLPKNHRGYCIVDGHGILIVRGKALRVPIEFFARLELREIVLVVGDPSDIRRNRAWPAILDSEISIKSLQLEEAAALASVAEELHVPIHEVNANDASQFEAIVLRRTGPTSSR